MDVQRSTMTMQVYEIIKNKIIHGEYDKGQKLTEQGTAKDLSVSATPVREAFKKLTAEGFIETLDYKGVFVKKYSKKDIREAYLVRAKLEGIVIQLMIEDLTEVKIKRLNEVVEKVNNSTVENVIYRYYPIYELIYLMSDSQVLLNNIRSISAIIDVEKLATIHEFIDAKKHHEQVMTLVEYILKRDITNAIQCSEAYILYLMDLVLDNIKE